MCNPLEAAGWFNSICRLESCEKEIAIHSSMYIPGEWLVQPFTVCSYRAIMQRGNTDEWLISKDYNYLVNLDSS